MAAVGAAELEYDHFPCPCFLLTIISVSAVGAVRVSAVGAGVAGAYVHDLPYR